MCGISGIIKFQTEGPEEEGWSIFRARLQKMSSSLQHRGPDGDAVWINHSGNAGLAHRRLAILDLTPAGAQPMHFLERYTIVYNGEIYNYLELRDELKKRGYSFNTESDTEVLLAAFDYYKEECLTRLDGMFAFVIWDEREQCLFAARDRFGEKPLYYSINEKEFCFASERKAIWASGIERKINYPLLLNWLVLGQTSTPAEKTICFYEEIFTIPPAHYLKLKSRSSHFELRSYWDLDKEKKILVPEEEAREKFLDLLKTSIKRRLRMDVKAGTSLSGGLDSSTLAALVSYLTHEKWDVFSAIFPGFERDESAYITKMVSTFRLNSHLTTPDENDLKANFKKLCYHQEEPFSSTSIFGQFKVYELASRHHNKVLMDGQGADEVLAGYGTYIHWHLQQLLREHPKSFMKEKRALKKNQIAFDWGFSNYLAAFFPGQVPGYLERRASIRIQNNHDLDPEFKNHFFDRQSIYKPLVLKLNDILYFDACQYGLEELLRYADRNSMAHGLEIRLPFLNHELVEFVFSLPAHYKIHHGWTKWLLRTTMENVLPDEIVWRRAKVGFETPQKSWMQKPGIREWIHESKKTLVAHKILKPAVLNKKIQPHDAHAAGNDDWRWLVAAAFFDNTLFT